MITHTSLDTLWEAIFALVEAHDAQPLSKHDGCWCLTIDDQWFMAINGKDEEKFVPYPGSEGTATVPPFTVFVVFNGWPFAFIWPAAAEIGCGRAANIDILYDAIVSATDRKKLEMVS